MTPVHIGEAMHGDTLTIVGIVLSVHIAGMYAIAPVTGWLTDRLGRRPVILTGVAMLVRFGRNRGRLVDRCLVERKNS